MEQQPTVCEVCQCRLRGGIKFAENDLSAIWRKEGTNEKCFICSGLFANLDRLLANLIVCIRASQYEFAAFQLNISEPIDLPIRERYFLKENVAENVDPLKVVLKWLLKAKLIEALEASMVNQTIGGLEKEPCFADLPPDEDPVNSLVIVDLDLTDQTDASENLCLALAQNLAQHNSCDLKQFQMKRQRVGKRKFLKKQQDQADTRHFSRVQIDKMLKDVSFNLSLDSLEPSIAKLDLQSWTCKVKVQRAKPLIITGRYVKLSRRLPQTPWFVGDERRLNTSVEEIIAPLIKSVFQAKNHVFVSSGREDVDVRCLGHGRPFLLELADHMLMPRSVTHLNKLCGEINKMANGLILVRDLQVTSDALASPMIKCGEVEKSKCYQALCRGSLSKLDQFEMQEIWVKQLTPVRVLHRRVLCERQRKIHILQFHSFDWVKANVDTKPELLDYLPWAEKYSENDLFVINLTCDAGTYVKEFVHGDLGRCLPNLCSILQQPSVDILALDVMAVNLAFPATLDDPDL